MGKAALELGVVTSALSQQISRLEGELSTRLLQRTSGGVVPTDAGLAFWRQAQLALRHIDDAALAARSARLSGHVSVGMAPSTASVLGVAFMQAMRSRYPDVRLHMVESLSGYLASMLSARQIDLAVLFSEESAQRWSVMPLLDERIRPAEKSRQASAHSSQRHARAAFAVVISVQARRIRAEHRRRSRRPCAPDGLRPHRHRRDHTAWRGARKARERDTDERARRGEIRHAAQHARQHLRRRTVSRRSRCARGARRCRPPTGAGRPLARCAAAGASAFTKSEDLLTAGW